MPATQRVRTVTYGLVRNAQLLGVMRETKKIRKEARDGGAVGVLH